MTKNEFIKKVEDMGFKVEEKGTGFTHINNDKHELARISNDKTYALDTDWSSFYWLSEKVSKDLFSILVEYTSTPLNERDETLYYLKLKRVPLGQDRQKIYLNYNTRLGVFDLEDKIEKVEWKTSFTKREIKLMDKDYGILNDYKIIEMDEI